ncbi:MAG: DUF2975 domain-containing protein [Pseudomonadota bacterium]
MKALGKGSIASFIRWALGFAWWVMWFFAGILTIAAIACTLFFFGLAVHAYKIETDGKSVLMYAPYAAIGFAFVGVSIAGTLAIIWRLRRLFTNFCAGDPFNKSNADHLRWIWIILLFMEVWKYPLGALTVALWAVAPVPVDKDGFNFDDHHNGIDFSTWFAILIIIVLAEVFREGARLREEQELTI